MKRHKFGVGAKERRTVNGIVFDSIAESVRFRELNLAERCGDIRSLELQPRYDWHTTYSANGRTFKRKHFYKADFRYIDVRTGDAVVEDVKGVRTAEYKRKKKIVEALYDIEIREV